MTEYKDIKREAKWSAHCLTVGKTNLPPIIKVVELKPHSSNKIIRRKAS